MQNLAQHGKFCYELYPFESKSWFEGTSNCEIHCLEMPGDRTSECVPGVRELTNQNSSQICKCCGRFFVRLILQKYELSGGGVSTALKIHTRCFPGMQLNVRPPRCAYLLFKMHKHNNMAYELAVSLGFSVFTKLT